jgi:hypothetical protein
MESRVKTMVEESGMESISDRQQGRRSRPALLANRRAIREAFLIMELRPPPIALRDVEHADSAGA